MCMRSTAGSLSAQDAFGNYVVQYVLELGHTEAAAAVMGHLTGRCAELSQQKFSSNVVEKCLKLTNPSLQDSRDSIIRELVNAPTLSRLLQVCTCACAWVRTGPKSFGSRGWLRVACYLLSVPERVAQ